MRTRCGVCILTGHSRKFSSLYFYVGSLWVGEHQVSALVSAKNRALSTTAVVHPIVPAAKASKSRCIVLDAPHAVAAIRLVAHAIMSTSAVCGYATTPDANANPASAATATDDACVGMTIPNEHEMQQAVAHTHTHTHNTRHAQTLVRTRGARRVLCLYSHLVHAKVGSTTASTTCFLQTHHAHATHSNRLSV